jgi:ankyrin repeat protein
LVKEKSVDVNAKDIEHDQNTALHIATEKGYVDTVKILVEDLNADINRDNIGGEYPIHVAGSCYCLNLDLTRYFIQKRSDYSEDVEDLLVDTKTNN